MAIFLSATNEKLEITTSAAADVDVSVSWVDIDTTDDSITPGSDDIAFTTATTKDIVVAPGANVVRNIQHLNIRNKDSVDASDVTIIKDVGGTDFQQRKVLLSAGEAYLYEEGLGWFKEASQSELNVLLVTTADVTNATTSWADITGLTYPVEANKAYYFECGIIYICNATTTGARFGVNGPAVSYLRGSGFGTVTGSVTAAALSTPAAAVSAVDTSMIGAQTTGPATEVYAHFSGVYVPSAAGTFAVRSQSEVAVASAVIIRRGSWCELREASNA